MTTDAGFDETPDPAGLAAPPPTPGRFDQVRARASKRNIGIGCLALAFMCGGCFYLLPTPDPQPSQPRGLMATAAATEVEVEQPTDEPTEEPTEVDTATPKATETEKATATDEPTAPPTATPVPTAVPPTAAPQFAYDPNPCDQLNCGDFAGKSTDPQEWWNARKSEQCPNPGGLDGDNDGSVCEEGEGGVPAAQPVAPPPPAPSSGCVNFNSASFDDLRRIIHVDDKIANHIIELRGQRPFSGWDDLVDRVNGIGKNNVKDIQAQGLGCF